MKKFLALAFTAILASSGYLAMTNSASAHGIGWRHSHGGFSIGIYSGGVGGHRIHRPRHRCYGRGCYRQRYRQYDPYYGDRRIYRGHRRVYRQRVIIYERPRRVHRRSHRRVHRVHRSNRHVRWCYNRFRSYRAWDNTFQPYHGRRRACRSPFF